MRKTILTVVMLAFVMLSCEQMAKKPTSDELMQKKTENVMREINRETGMPALTNFQEKKNLKWIYELCDQEKLICHAYLFNEMKGEIGQYLGKCIGYGIPYSTQYSNPQKVSTVDGGQYGARNPYILPQPEPNGLFKPEGMSATWLIMIDPKTKKPRPVYVEPTIIVSPFKLK